MVQWAKRLMFFHSRYLISWQPVECDLCSFLLSYDLALLWRYKIIPLWVPLLFLPHKPYFCAPHFRSVHALLSCALSINSRHSANANRIEIERSVWADINTFNSLCLSASLQWMVPQRELPRDHCICCCNITTCSHETAGWVCNIMCFLQWVTNFVCVSAWAYI